VFPNLSGADIRELSIIVPDADSRHEFNETVRPLRERIWSNIKENEMLSEIRNLLLPKLISGEVRVKEATKIVEAELELHL
jgi:type I restriction enzyme S subunit